MDCFVSYYYLDLLAINKATHIDEIEYLIRLSLEHCQTVDGTLPETVAGTLPDTCLDTDGDGYLYAELRRETFAEEH